VCLPFDFLQKFYWPSYSSFFGHQPLLFSFIFFWLNLGGSTDCLDGELREDISRFKEMKVQGTVAQEAQMVEGQSRGHRARQL
jgi:hypothetical protein